MRNGKSAKKKEWEMRREYDFSDARPNKYAKKYAEGTNLVMIDPDLMRFFPDAESVNATLRALVAIIPKPRAKRILTKARKRRASSRHKAYNKRAVF